MNQIQKSHYHDKLRIALEASRIGMFKMQIHKVEQLKLVE